MKKFWDSLKALFHSRKIGKKETDDTITYEVILTLKWLKDKITEKLAKKYVEKVAIVDLKKVLDMCDDVDSKEILKNLMNEGYTHMIAETGHDGKIIDVEGFRNISETIDEEVETLINRTNEGMIIVEG